ncbi:MAG: helix-turn-helix transcriptional regulator [Terriglobales bacterium]
MEQHKPQRLSSSAPLEIVAPRNTEPRDPAISPVSVQTTAGAQQEHFVDAEIAAAYLRCSRKHILRLSRLGIIPAHPISFGRRVTWRYLLTEVREWVLSKTFPITVASNATSGRRMAGGSPRKGGR